MKRIDNAKSRGAKTRVAVVARTRFEIHFCIFATTKKSARANKLAPVGMMFQYFTIMEHDYLQYLPNGI